MCVCVCVNVSDYRHTSIAFPSTLKARIAKQQISGPPCVCVCVCMRMHVSVYVTCGLFIGTIWDANHFPV